MIRIVLFSVCAVCFLSGQAFASEAPSEAEPTPDFAILDRNSDGGVTLAELFPEDSKPQGELHPYRARQRQAFEQADRNRDGRLDRGELEAAAPIRELLSATRWLDETVRPQFTQADADENGQLSLAEYLAAVPKPRHAAARRDFGVFDFDGKGGLTFTEYVCLPSVAPAWRRGPVPDPVAARAEQEIAAALALLQKHDADGDGLLPQKEWEMAAAGSWYGPFFKSFDSNADGAISAAETRAALEVAFGLREPSGGALRRDSGHVFIWHTLFSVWDRDRDLALSREEFVPRFWGGPEAAGELFAAADGDADGRLSLAELVRNDFTWGDVVQKFLNWDKDRDGALSAPELEKGAASWERPYLPQLLPGYDTDADADGKLSLAEFRGTPLANVVLNWSGKPKDADEDGRLTLAEFHPNREWRFLGVSRFFFERLDHDRSGFLEPDELPFDVDLNRASADVVFRVLDRDRDRRLSSPEAFAPTVLIAHHGSIFDDADSNRDGGVDSSEFKNAPELVAAILTERRLRGPIQAALARKDTNGDGLLSRDEWLAGVAAEKAAAVQSDAALCDFDRDRQTSLVEYACLQGLSAIDRRGPVPDPIVTEVDRLVREFAPQLSAAAQGGGESAALPRGVTPAVLKTWDADHDGTLSRSEVRHGLEVVYGVRHPGGLPLRHANGRVFDWRTFRAYDQNGDGVLDNAEFVARYWEGAQKGASAFAAADNDHDGRLTLAELAGHQLLWNDTFSLFRRFDKDGSGVISPAELAARARSWEQNYVTMLFPAFDTDQDGGLSFIEFRGTPLGNPLADWNAPRVDQNLDGSLSLDEFHADSSSALRGLSALFLSRIDLNGDGKLSRREFAFRIDLLQASDEVAFAVLDANGDRRLALAEMIEFSRPPASDAKAQQRHEERIVRIENAFQKADADQSGDLSAVEFANPDAVIAAVVTGRPVPARASQPDAAVAAVAPVATGARSWRAVGLIAVNILLAGGVAWLLMRARAHS